MNFAKVIIELLGLQDVEIEDIKCFKKDLKVKWHKGPFDRSERHIHLPAQQTSESSKY